MKLISKNYHDIPFSILYGLIKLGKEIDIKKLFKKTKIYKSCFE